MKTREDFELDQSPPRTLRQLVMEQLDYSQLDGKTVPVDNVNDLLNRIYKHIEAEAVRRYKSNQLWAIKAWTYENILQDAASKEAACTDETLLDELVRPIADWQQGEFDPIRNFRRTLELSERTPGYIRECLRVAHKVVAKYGKKRNYTPQELMEFIGEEHDRYKKSTYTTRLHVLKAFLGSFPADENGNRPILPIRKIPPYPRIEEFQRPTFTRQEIDKLIYWAVKEAKPDIALRLCIASVYGTRVGELAMLSSKHINLQDKTITIPPEKHGRRLPQPIPTELVPLFKIPLEPMSGQKIQRQLQWLCKKAGVPIRPRTGIHSIRRSVATALFEDEDLKELWVYRFLRWAEQGAGLGVMPRYIRTPISETDAKVISRHPYVKTWKDMMKMLEHLEHFRSTCAISQYPFAVI